MEYKLVALPDTSNSWETNDLTEDELNFKPDNTPIEIEPNDRGNFVYFIILLHGIGILMPWNMFITAEQYFVDYKLNVSASNYTYNEADNVTISQSSSTTEYRENFLSYLGLAAQVPNVAFNGLNLFIQSEGQNLTLRVTFSIIIELIIFIITVTLAIIDSTAWPGTFFYLTMSSVVVLNMANGVYQNSIYGLAAKFPMKYTNAVVLGSNISGVLATLISITTTAFTSNVKNAAIYYFITALFFLFACFDTYFALPLSKFYRYHMRPKKEASHKEDNSQRIALYIHVFKKSWMQCFNVFLIFFVTLAIFPAVYANVEQIDKDFIISKKYFVTVTCFLVFNIFAMVGNLIPNLVLSPKPDKLWIPVVSRLLLIPFFLYCNYKPNIRAWPVYITNDYIYLLGGVILATSSGYYSSLAMMYAPKCVEPKHAPIAGMMAAFFLICGIFLGINFSFVLSWIVKQTF